MHATKLLILNVSRSDNEATDTRATLTKSSLTLFASFQNTVLPTYECGDTEDRFKTHHSDHSGHKVVTQNHFPVQPIQDSGTTDKVKDSKTEVSRVGRFSKGEANPNEHS
jgi:hypothetical protein